MTDKKPYCDKCGAYHHKGQNSLCDDGEENSYIYQVFNVTDDEYSELLGTFLSKYDAADCAKNVGIEDIEVFDVYAKIEVRRYKIGKHGDYTSQMIVEYQQYYDEERCAPVWKIC